MNTRLLIHSLGILLFTSCSEVDNKHQTQFESDFTELMTLDDLNQIKVYYGFDNLPENKDSVFRLNLSEKGMTKLPVNIFDFPNLQELNVSLNTLSDLKGIEKLTNIQVLNIGMNDFKSFPMEITKLRKLKVLSLYWNDIKSFPDEFYKNNTLIEQLNLTSMFEFDFENNLENIHQFKKLKQLNLGNNQIPVLNINFKEIRNLETFTFIRQDSIDVYELISGLSYCNKLKTVYLTYDNITELPVVIGELQSLESLHLDYNKINVLPKEITKLRSLKKVFLYDNPIKETKIKSIEKEMLNTEIYY